MTSTFFWMGELLNELDKDEIIFADKGYQGVSVEVITPIKGKILSSESETLNVYLSSIRQIDLIV
ncbi:hypothetical protein PPL_00841 [Heterostelium album PN500]|uniref:Uncharacterized protein n=1 Tax=Heterostelium pallidum (strain ATCC 26659 / Pp 5 / PN500) TaxID=670386 RepID=D3AXL0_HETP5|nr:hypothetical protein PPL_00841 [Heterostelium album PN500]EFA86279.1 hypothetical protein PPL_00841 [Heterostelium album PN500]|eukprot:XP_020438384.1 hypothetical protein PPL_00841 [Heterostelium album PN500]